MTDSYWINQAQVKFWVVYFIHRIIQLIKLYFAGAKTLFLAPAGTSFVYFKNFVVFNRGAEVLFSILSGSYPELAQNF